MIMIEINEMMEINGINEITETTGISKWLKLE